MRWFAIAIAAAAINLASPSTVRAQTFDDCGVLVQGVECVLFQADGGGLYIVASAGFSLGDYVRVTGDLDPFCISICQQGNGCVFGGTVELCNPVVEPEFIRGDVNGDGALDVADPVALLTALFTPGSDPVDCEDAADANDDGALDISDPVTLLSALFTMGPDPSPPFPDCGEDPTVDGIGCEEFSFCP